ncbi:deoxyribodipyrimidine photo-lyase [Desulfosarcina alkanivorans]|jgi:deoxyribodipyrimidine photo-lyase|uniref:Deoxyribodipyrimidine photo-lyase n=1 Tax=Desulfosarcina alkanivorans TaxID=571177 RepID=A0A5K7YSI2_9BACT|nr:deoxyribodipyrimidine photo-lyase [Desulfosarcina alkanivorans]BBO71355.1 deoxyribodipyrimidine photo-lyase [Desulfosarcina alkanivorans]
MGIAKERVTILNDTPIREGKWVLYWMQQSQRAHDNPALEYAILRANRLDLPVLVAFALTDSYPEANLRHYRFMLEGLAETRTLLARRRIGMLVQKGEPHAVLGPLLGQTALLVCDVGYTRHQHDWRRMVSQSAPCRTVAVEGDVVVPVAVVSAKAEYAARTIRPKIHKHLEQFLVPCPRYRPTRSSVGIHPAGLDLTAIDAILGRLDIDRSVPAVTPFFKGGPRTAKKRLGRFITHGLPHYDKHRNQPQTDDISQMSPYLHFGQISPVFLALAVAGASTGGQADRDAYLEEVIVRRELAANFVHYTPDYDRFSCLPAWAKKSLAAHAADRRTALYDRRTLEAADTHDPYWNAAMAEMRDTGFMHNYMRMYWGKKILEWSASPEAAFDTAMALNNRYFLDGRDPNSFAGVGWVFGLHDRAWFEREIFGKVRYLAASGLERKCDICAYVAKVAALSRKAGRADAARGRGRRGP